MLTTNKVGALPVRNSDGRLVGVISERDIVRAFAIRDNGINELLAGELMTRNAVTCSPDDNVDTALRKMSSRRIRHLPVIEDDKLIGMLSIRDALEAKLQASELEANVLRDISIASRHS
jgi:CBS domain-containing protein